MHSCHFWVFMTQFALQDYLCGGQCLPSCVSFSFLGAKSVSQKKGMNKRLQFLYTRQVIVIEITFVQMSDWLCCANIRNLGRS